MRNRIPLFVSILLMLTVALAACGPAPAADAPAQEAPAAEEAPATEEAAAEEPAAEEPAAEEAAPAPTEAPAEEADEEAAADDDAATEAGAQTFVIDPTRSTASYLVDEEFLAGALDKLGIAAGQYDIVGSTDQIEGSLQVDVANTSVNGGEFRVNVSALSTDQNRRDRWVREEGAGFDTYPTAVFVVTGVENAPEAYTEGEEVSFQLLGDMTIRDVTQPLTFDVTATLADGVLSGRAFAETLMTDFGIEPPNFANTLRAANEFAIEVNFVAEAQ